LVNDTTVKLAPQGALDQRGHALSRIIYAFAEAEEDAKIFMAKWDIKDGFWQLNCEVGEEFNFAYVLPSGSRHADCNSCTLFATDGVGGIPTTLLHSNGNRKGYRIGL
jgi:hypothetical protein